MTEYKGFKYWLIETKPDRSTVWRIQFPGGHKTPPIQFPNELAVQAEIDKIIVNTGVIDGR